MQGDAFDGLAGWAEDLDPDEWLWLPGVDYATGWRTAKDAADAVNCALLEVGLRPEEVRATAGTLADGAPVVRLRCTMPGALQLTRLLQGPQPGNGGAGEAA